MSQHIAVIEDDQRLAELIGEFLQQNGYRVTVIDRGDEAVTTLPEINPDLIVLDLMLPGLDGIEVCKAVRSWFHGAIIMLTAKSSPFDQVIGLEMGADDYVVKPADPHVLLARIRALFRRTQKETLAENISSRSELLQFGCLTIDSQAQQVTLNSQEVILTTREFQLLKLLADHAGSIISRDEIFARTRGLDYDGVDRSVDVRISKLRRKLGDDSEHPFRIKTIWGKGYLFVPSAWED